MKLTKHDLILTGVLVVLALAGLLAFKLFFGSPGATVCICIDGETFKEVPLNTDAEIEIPGKNGKCFLSISHGTADMVKADCPNQICVRHKPVSNSGESIICLPNRVSVGIK